MSFEPDNTVNESEVLDVLNDIKCELKKIVAILSDVHDVDISNEDVNNDCD